jgi:hypothetical protein
MKRLIAGLCAGLIAAGAWADTVMVTKSVSNGQAIAYSNPINVSGWLDKIEIVQSASSTSTVTIATYSGTTAMETYASLVGWTGTSKLIRPRVLPTDNTGTTVTGATSTNTAITAVTTVMQ